MAAKQEPIFDRLLTSSLANSPIAKGNLMKTWSLVSLAILIAGCSTSVSTDYHKLNLGTVTGNVKLEGEPLAGYHIIFQSEKGTFSYGKTDKNGDYKLMFNSQKAGVTKGTKTVRIRKRGFSESELFPGPEEDTEENEEAVAGDMVSVSGQGNRKSKDGLPDAYHLKSHIQVEVTDTSQVINFDLKSDGSTTGPT